MVTSRHRTFILRQPIHFRPALRCPMADSVVLGFRATGSGHGYEKCKRKRPKIAQHLRAVRHHQAAPERERGVGLSLLLEL